MDNENKIIIDFIEILKRLIKRKTLISAVLVCSIILGYIVASILPKEYVSNVRLIADNSSTIGGIGRFSNLAQQFGVLNGAMSANNDLPSPFVYNDVMISSDFLYRLIKSEIKHPKIDSLISIQEYTLKYHRANPIIEYTLGLPSKILGLFSSTSGQNLALSTDLNSDVNITRSENSAIGRLRSYFTYSRDVQSGVMTISVVTQDPDVSVQIAMLMQSELLKFAIEFRTEKARNSLIFLEEMAKNLKEQYDASQTSLAEFTDSNKGVLTESAKVELSTLQNEVTLRFGIYRGIMEELEQAKLRVQLDTPVIKTIQSPTYPYSHIYPSKVKFVGFFAIMGLVFSVLYVLNPFQLK